LLDKRKAAPYIPVEPRTCLDQPSQIEESAMQQFASRDLMVSELPEVDSLAGDCGGCTNTGTSTQRPKPKPKPKPGKELADHDDLLALQEQLRASR
jgi:hypothetical protein